MKLSSLLAEYMYVAGETVNVNDFQSRLCLGKKIFLVYPKV